MTEQWEAAMLELYKRESMCSDHVKKAVIDEALDQLMRWQDSKQEPAWLVRNALSNAQKKVHRYGQRMTGPVDEVCLEGPWGELGLVELLLMAYARAESLNPNADTVYSELRSYWGIFLGSYMDVLTNTMKK